MAVDIQGPDVVRPYVDQFKVTFPVAVDTADVFGQAFQLKAIPVSYLVDEVGIIRLKGMGPDKKFLKGVESILAEPLTDVRGRSPQLPSARATEDLDARIAGSSKDWAARLARALQHSAAGEFDKAVALCQDADAIQPRESQVSFTWGMVLLQQGQREAGLKRLRQARDLDPENWRIRKQIWAIEHPDKFYTDRSPDYGWQKKELARERSKR